MVLVIYSIYTYHFIDLLFTGVFAAEDIKIGTVICFVPAFYFESPTELDHQRPYVWELEGDIHRDSTAFSEIIVEPNGFGHFLNTSFF